MKLTTALYVDFYGTENVYSTVHGATAFYANVLLHNFNSDLELNLAQPLEHVLLF